MSHRFYDFTFCLPKERVFYCKRYSRNGRKELRETADHLRVRGSRRSRSQFVRDDGKIEADDPIFEKPKAR